MGRKHVTPLVAAVARARRATDEQANKRMNRQTIWVNEDVHMNVVIA